MLADVTEGYKSAWLADLVATFTLEITNDLFKTASLFHGIYRNDGNQALKYLNRGSSHTLSFSRAIPCGVLSRLVRLTSNTRKNINSKMDELYPLHFKALNILDLASKKILTLKNILHPVKSYNIGREEREDKTWRKNTSKSISVLG